MCVVKMKKLRRERKKRRVAGERRIDRDREREGKASRRQRALKMRMRSQAGIERVRGSLRGVGSVPW